MPSLFLAENSLLRICLPISVLGDVHGQYPDFKEALRITGVAPFTRLLFLGDYVDRGI